MINFCNMLFVLSICTSLVFCFPASSTMQKLPLNAGASTSDVSSSFFSSLSISPLTRPLLHSLKHGNRRDLLPEKAPDDEESDDQFIPFNARQIDPSTPPSGFCTQRVTFPTGLREIKTQRMRKIYAFRNNIVKFRYKLTVRGKLIKVRLRALGNRRIARVAINFFLPPIRLRHKNQLGPIIRFDYTNPANKGYARTFDITTYPIPAGKSNCCNTQGQIGFFIKTCNPAVKTSQRCGYRLMSVPFVIKCAKV